MTLFPEDIDRIMPELSFAFERFPSLEDAGIIKWVNGAFTFTPDGNPLVGPISGIPGYWAACGVMAGFSQCAGIGLALANWIVDGDPGLDAFGMDIARFGPYASDEDYLLATTRQFYARRFVMALPQRAAARRSPVEDHTLLRHLQGGPRRVLGQLGLEVPLYFAPSADFEENYTLGRSNAEPIVAEEVEATRTTAGLYEIAQYSRYEVSGPAAEAWLDHIMALASRRSDASGSPRCSTRKDGWRATSRSHDWMKSASG